MEPIGVWVRKNGEWAIIHRCRVCGELSANRIAADDNPQLLMSIAVKPLAMPPFPLGMLSNENDRFDNKSTQFDHGSNCIQEKEFEHSYESLQHT